MAILVVKANIPTSDIAQSLINGSAVLIVLFNVLVLIDLVQMAFKIGPNIP